MDASVFDFARRWVRKRRWWLGGFAVLLLLYALAGFLWLPQVARHAIEQYVRRDLGRQVAIGSLRFNPFTLTAEVRQFRLAEADDSPIASFELLRVNASTSSLLHWAWTLQEVRLEQPRVHVLVNRDGSLNLAKLVPATAPQAAPTRSSWPALRIGTLTVHQGSVQFEDRSREEPFVTTLTPVEFSLTDFRTAPKFENRYRFSASTTAGERLDWSGEFSLQPLGSTGQFAVTGLKAETVTSYLADALPFAIPTGSLDFTGEYRFAVGADSSLSLKIPSLKIRDLRIAPRSRGVTATAADTGAGAGSGSGSGSGAGAGAGAAEAAAWIALPQLEVADTEVALDRRRIAIGQVMLKDAALRVWRDSDGSLNLRQLWPARAVTAATAPAAAASGGTGNPGAAVAAPWQVSLARLRVEGMAIDAQDRSVKPAATLRLAPISFTLQNYSSDGAQPLTFELDAALGDSGRLASRGSLVLQPLTGKIAFELKEFDLPLLQPYASLATDMTIYRGRFAAQGNLHLFAQGARAASAFELAATVDVTNLATRDNVMNEDFIAWQTLHIAGLRYRLRPDALSIDRIVVRHPYGRVIVGKNGSLNVATILRPAGGSVAQKAVQEGESAQGAKSVQGATPVQGSQPAATSEARPSSGPAMPIRIGGIDIRGGTADFSDRSIEPNFSAGILGLKGSVEGLSSDPASRAKVALTGSVDRYAPVSITGQVNLLSAATYSDIAMNFSNIELTTFDPYSGKFAGYSIAQGKLTTAMHYHVDHRRLEATHHIVIDQLEFGAATESKQAVPLPIRLAAALLKDRNGVITLDLPVGGSLDDPSFRVGPIVWKVFIGLITKIVTAPFALLGSLFGGGEQLAYVDFAAGSALLPPSEAQKLSQLSNALVERPQLKLDIPLHAANDDDDAALAKVALEQAVAAASASATSRRGAARRGTVTANANPTSPRLDALAALYRSKFDADPEYPATATATASASAAAQAAADRSAWLEQQLLPQFTPNRAQREALARARAEAAQAAVLANKQVPPERVFLTERVSGGGPEGTVRMELKLQ